MSKLESSTILEKKLKSKKFTEATHLKGLVTWATKGCK